MRSLSVKDDSWVHIFEKRTFSGRIRRLRPGQGETARQIGSIIVGPKAIAKIVTKDGQEFMTLPSRKVIADLSQLIPKRRAFHVRVCEAC